MSVDAPTLEQISPKPSIKERLVGLVRKNKIVREQTPEEQARAQAIAEFKEINKAFAARVKEARTAFLKIPQTFSKVGGRYIAPENQEAFNVALKNYQEVFMQYRQFIFTTSGSEVAKRITNMEADKASGQHINLLAAKVLGLAGAGVTVAVTGGYNAVLSMIPGIGVSQALRHKKAIGTESKRVSAQIHEKEAEAIAAGKTYEQFVKENAALLAERGRSKVWRFSARWGAGLATSVGMYSVLHHSLGQIASGTFDHMMHDRLAKAFGDRAAEHLANGTGDYARFLTSVRGLVHDVAHKVGSGLAVLNEAVGTGGSAEAAEPTTHLITRLATAPNAGSRVEAFTPKSIAEAADGLIKGGMNPEARDEFIAAATAQANNKSPQFIEFTKRVWEAMVYRVKGTEQVLGVGAEKVMIDTSRDMRAASAAPVVYRAEEFSFPYIDSQGVHRVITIDVPEGTADGKEKCFNFAFFDDKIIPETPPLPPPVPEKTLPPPVHVANNIHWSLQRGFIAADCSQCGLQEKATDLLIVDYKGEGVLEAERYLLAAVKDGIIPANYQSIIQHPFVYLHFQSTLTGKPEFLCLNLKTGEFSHPFIEVNGKETLVTTEAQFQGLVTGTDETLRMTGSGRSADISVISPKDPIPLFPVDTNHNGAPDKLFIGTDTNGDGILQPEERGRTLVEIVNNQIFLIGNDILPQGEGNEAAQKALEKVFLSKIPEGFITGRTEAEKFAALKAAFGDVLNDAQLKELGGWLHFYSSNVYQGPGAAYPDGLASLTKPDGTPQVIFGFLKEGITNSAEPKTGGAGDFPDLMK
ncbi:MAG: hypothetical protein V4437_00365 [Patescibacteria group bacterium]